MKYFTYNQIYSKLLKIVKRFIKTQNKNELGILRNINYKYSLYPYFWEKIASKSNQELLHAIIINIYKTYDIIKTLNYYLANMSKNNNEVKYYNILEYIAISYRHIAPTLPKLKILYQIN